MKAKLALAAYRPKQLTRAGTWPKGPREDSVTGTGFPLVLQAYLSAAEPVPPMSSISHPWPPSGLMLRTPFPLLPNLFLNPSFLVPPYLFPFRTDTHTPPHPILENLLSPPGVLWVQNPH